MARFPIREILRFKNPLLSFSMLSPSKPSSLSSSSASSYSCSSFNSYSENSTTSTHISTLVLLKSCQNMRHLFQVQAQLITTGLFLNPFIAARVLKYSADYGTIDYTVLIFRNVKSPHPFCINILIKAYSTSLEPHRAVLLYFEMLRNGFLPNSFTFPPLISSCAKSGCIEDGRKCHGHAFKNGVDTVLPVVNSLIHMYGSCGELETALQMFTEMPKRDLVSWNSILASYAALGELGAAHKLFDAMPESNVVSWNIMINGYLEGGNPGCGLKLFREMMNTGLRGSDTTMVSVLTSCGRSARLKEGKSVHGSLMRSCSNPSLIMDTALIDMYSKCQRVEIAQKVFDRMINRNLFCWNAMVLGHCIHGNPEDGLNLFGKMVHGVGPVDGGTEFCRRTKPDKGHGVLPDEITFIGVLCACARLGQVIEGRSHFNQMINLFGIKPSFSHFWCMANLFAGAGLHQEAVATLKNIPQYDEDASSQSSVWAGFLGLCRFQGGIALGEKVAKSLIELEPQNLSCYALLLNIYAVAGQWEDVAKVKEMIRVKGFKKIPGCSLLDLKETVHELKVRDQWRIGIEEIASG